MPHSSTSKGQEGQSEERSRAAGTDRTRGVTLTHALVVVKDPAGFAVEAFVVLRPRTLPTRVVASCRERHMAAEKVHVGVGRDGTHGTCAGSLAGVGALLPVVAVSTVLAQVARVSRVTHTLSIAQTSPLPLAAPKASTHTTWA